MNKLKTINVKMDGTVDRESLSSVNWHTTYTYNRVYQNRFCKHKPGCYFNCSSLRMWITHVNQTAQFS